MTTLKTVKVTTGKYNLVQGKEVVATFEKGLGGNYEGRLSNGCLVTATSLKSIVSLSERALKL